ncbi:hypothetical protein CPY51_23045 [Rhizobium tubonense]|uniref:Uncharacterized protein n=1 Tax=Rhizobium tubonense TaxID=484088 RepID=A0A2W4CAV0_9HYPH|nr:hypothetical protein CPY51_23045 [Rhizobium tubonense]
MTDTSRLRRASGLALVLLTCLGSWSGTRAKDVRNDARVPLPLVLKDYEAFVQKLADEVDGNEAAMATKLRSLGFSCTPGSKSVTFECVRFGCQKRSMGLGSLLQWTVLRSDVGSGKAVFSGAAINYLWWARCIPVDDIEQAQQRFLSRHGPIQ